ncbi:MAG: XTP/dITP diphosphatase [Planctomycetota bacterium]|jgi:XTP/dITP diphosphohydrolase
MREIVVATRNPHKLDEVRAILARHGLRALGVAEFNNVPEVVEDGATFEANASKKAETVARATGRTCVADDSGLVVDALDGAPGILSARYAGMHGDSASNNAKLLRELETVADDGRSARFVCAIAIAAPSGEPRVFRGECEGRITTELRGEGGFGYDPLFYSPELGQTFAEASSEQKNGVSHRARALQKLGEEIASGRLDEWL